MVYGSPSLHFQSAGVFRSKMSYRQHVDGSLVFLFLFLFFIHCDTLCLLIGAFNPFIFRVIVDRYEFSAFVLPVKLAFLVMFSVPL